MKKKITLMLLLSALMTATATAQETKLVKGIHYGIGSDNNFRTELKRVLGDDLYRVDSLVISADVHLPYGWTSALLDCCENGRLTGIDMSQCRYETEIPSAAFLPTMVNGAPRKSADGGNGSLYMNGLRYITLPVNLEKIGNLAFSSCGLQAIAIPYWVKEIGSGAFHNCNNLKNVVLYGDKPHDETMGWQFSGLPHGAVLHVAPGCGRHYRGKDGWASFGEVREDDTAFKTMTHELDGSKPLKGIMGSDYMCVDSMKISGVLNAGDFETLRHNAIYGRLYSIDFSGLDVDASKRMFISSSKLDYLIMPKTVREIPGSFLAKSSVRHLVMPESYEKICHTAFRFFKGTLPDSMFVIPEGCRRIDTEAFGLCGAVRSMVLPSTLDVLEPWSLGFNYWSPETDLAVDLYVNRMTPPVFVSEMSGTYDDYYAEEGPFGAPMFDYWPMHASRLFVPVGAKKNYENAEYWNHFLEIVETPLLTGTSAGIIGTTVAAGQAGTDEIYTVDGRRIEAKGTATGNLPRGLYIVKQNGQARKVLMGR